MREAKTRSPKFSSRISIASLAWMVRESTSVGQDALDVDVGVEVLADHLQRVLELDQPAHREILALHGDDHLVGRRQGVDRQQPEARRRVDADEVVVLLDRLEGALERALAADHRAHRDLGAGEVDRGAGDVDLALLDDLLDREPVHEHVEHRLLDRVGIDALGHRQVALRVHVAAEDAVALLGEGAGEVQRRRRLGDAALLVRERDDLGLVLHGRLSFLSSGIPYTALIRTCVMVSSMTRAYRIGTTPSPRPPTSRRSAADRARGSSERRRRAPARAPAASGFRPASRRPRSTPRTRRSSTSWAVGGWSVQEDGCFAIGAGDVVYYARLRAGAHGRGRRRRHRLLAFGTTRPRSAPSASRGSTRSRLAGHLLAGDRHPPVGARGALPRIEVTDPPDPRPDDDRQPRRRRRRRAQTGPAERRGTVHHRRAWARAASR